MFLQLDLCVSNLTIFCLIVHGQSRSMGKNFLTRNLNVLWMLVNNETCVPFDLKTPSKYYTVYPFFTGKIDIPPTRIWNWIRQFLNCWFGIYRIFDSKFTGTRQASLQPFVPRIIPFSMVHENKYVYFLTLSCNL